MAAEVETMFYTREKPWHGLGTLVAEAPESREALRIAGLNWKVLQEPVYTENDELIQGYKANVRDSDRKILGVVTDRYKVIQNEEAFAFTDALLGEGVRYETAGSLQEGRRVWLLARLPREYIIAGERISPYMVFSNTHDGSGAVKTALTPIRVVCNNTLNLALRTAKRSWSMIHTGDISGKIEENFSPQQKRGIERLREDMRMRYFDAPDLKDVGNNGYRFINAVSDFATHSTPRRKTANYRENIFARTADGNPLIDRAYQMVLVA